MPKPVNPIDPSKIPAVAETCKMFADETRIKIIGFVANEEHTVTAICQHLGQSQPAVSHHLALLRVSGTVVSRREGKHVCYILTPKGREALAALEAMANG